MTSEEATRIFSEIEACPPLMRDEAKAAYLSREVDWILTLVDGREDQPGWARLMFRRQRNDLPYVAARVPLSDCPWLRYVHSGETVRLRGRIADVNARSIELESASVSQVIEAGHCPPRLS